MAGISGAAVPDYRKLAQVAYGEAMIEVWDRGLSVTLHHDDYPRWTCTLWRDLGKMFTKIEVVTSSFDPLDALQKAIEEVRKLDAKS